MTRSNKKPTIKDVASMAGVSIATVSYVINGKEGQRIPEETKNKIFHAINILGYAPNPHAVAIKTERAKDIILRTHNRTTSLQDLENICFLQRFTPYCISEGYTVTLSADKRAQRVPATACVCLSLKPEDFRALAKENFVPLIGVDTLLYDPVFFQVTNNYKAIAELATAHYGLDFTYVTITPNDDALKEEIQKHLPNTVFVKHISELRDLNPHNAVVTDYCLEKFLTADKILVLRQLQENKLMAVMDCVKKAVKLPQVAKKEILILTQEEQNALHMAAQESHTIATFGIIFTLSTGIRMGEMLGLQWGDVDYRNHTVKIRRTVGRLQKVDESGKLIPKTAGIPTTEIVARSPKSVTAQRTIPLFSQVWNDLMTYYKKQQTLLQAQGIPLTPTTPIFSTPFGLVYEPRTYEDLFKRTLSEAGVPDINFHALRHTFATRALEAGMDIKVLSSILGHAQASTTLNLYAHALPDHKRQSMEKMSSFYGSTLDTNRQNDSA